MCRVVVCSWSWFLYKQDHFFITKRSLVSWINNRKSYYFLWLLVNHVFLSNLMFVVNVLSTYQSIFPAIDCGVISIIFVSYFVIDSRGQSFLIALVVWTNNSWDKGFICLILNLIWLSCGAWDEVHVNGC